MHADMDDDPLLDHAREVYALGSLTLFENEYEKSRPLVLDVTSEHKLGLEYKVKRMGHEGHSHKVSASFLGDIVYCCCKRFQVTGMLCSHALAVLQVLHVEKIHDRYLPKWRMKSMNQSFVGEPFCRKKRQCQPSLDDCLSGELGRCGTKMKTNASGTLSYWQENDCADSDHFGSPVLRHAKQIYLPKNYNLFREEYRKSEYLIVQVTHQAVDRRGLVFECEVYRYGRIDIKKVHAEAKDGTVKCSCRKFNKSGILCSHALAVFGCICLVRIPHQYIVPKLLNDPKESVQRKIHGPHYEELLKFAGYMVAQTGSTTLRSGINFGLGRKESKDGIMECLIALQVERAQMLLNDMKEKGASGSGMQEMVRGKAKFYDDQLLKNFTYKKSEIKNRKLWEYLKISS